MIINATPNFAYRYRGNATRQDISTVIGAIKQYAKLTIATGKIADMQSYAVASF